MFRGSTVSRRRSGAVAFLALASVFFAAAPCGAGLLGNAVGAWPAGLAANSLNENLVGGLSGALDRALSGALSDDPDEAEAAFDDAKYAVGKTARDMIPGAALLDLFGERLQTAKRRIGGFLGSARAALGPAAAGADILGADALPKANLRAALPAQPPGGTDAAAGDSPDPWSAAATSDPWSAGAPADPWANILADGAGTDPWAPAPPAVPDIAQDEEEPPAPDGTRDARYARAVGGAEAKSFDDALEDLRRREAEARRAAQRAEAERRRAEREAEARRERERAEAERRKAEARRERERREAEERRERERIEARNREFDRIEAQNRADNWNMFFEGLGNALGAYNDMQQQRVADAVQRRQQQARLEAERQREWRRQEEARAAQARDDDARIRRENERRRQAEQEEARRRQEEERRRAEAQRRADEERRKEAERQARENRRAICRAMLAGSRTSCVEVGEWSGGGTGWRLKNNCNYPIAVWHNFPDERPYSGLTHIPAHGRGFTSWNVEGRRKLRYTACVHDGGVSLKMVSASSKVGRAPMCSELRAFRGAGVERAALFGSGRRAGIGAGAPVDDAAIDSYGGVV